MKVFSNITGFEWDDGNSDKNLIKHRVSDEECEEVFFNDNKKLLKDILHSQDEDRYILLGEAGTGVKMFIVFTLRRSKIRVISARRLNKREYKLLDN